jgi:hydroxymethylbilane synthase
LNDPVIRIATRGSAQAVTQAEHVAEQLRGGGFTVELVLIDTHGDRTQSANVPLHTIGGQGVFVKEIQLAVLDGRADVAVHSAKDLPTAAHDGLTIGAYTRRRSPADALVGRPLVDLAGGAIVATGSVRRRAQLHRARPDLEFVELRGNIDTRLGKIPAGGSIVIAVAALEVLGLTDQIAQILDPAEFVPAVGQGCVAVECRGDDRRLLSALEQIDDFDTRAEVSIERAFLAELGSGCSLPVGAYADGGKLYTFLADDDSAITVSETIELSGDLAADIALAAASARAARDHVLSGR